MTTTATYTDRLAAALAERLGDAATVTPDRHDVYVERGNARARVHVDSRVDRRRPVTPDAVDLAVEAAASRLARDVPHYRPEFVAPARQLVAILRAGKVTGTGVYGGAVEAAERCAYVLTGTDIDGTEFHRCVVHDCDEVSPDAPCAHATNPDDVCPGCGVGAPWDHKPGCPDDPDHL